MATTRSFIGNIKGPQGNPGKDGRSIVSITKDDNNDIIVNFNDGTVEKIGKLNIDVQADFLTETGFGNLRYYNNHFQYYDTNSAMWIDSSVTSDNTYIINMTPQEMKYISGVYDVELGFNKLKFEEPSDTIIDGQAVCIVEKIIIRRKLDSEPIDENDGILVCEIRRRDFGKYKNSWYIDDSFSPINGEVWHYRAFPVSTTGFINTISLNETSVLCKDYYLFGFVLDQNESDPASMITYIEDNKVFKSAYMNYTTDKFDYGDWRDVWFIKNLKPCMLNYDGTIAYELDKNDYSLKLDGSQSDIANENFEGNVMVGFPKVYWKAVDNSDNTANIYFSNKKIDDDFVCWSHIDNNGNEIDYCYMPAYNGSNINNILRSISGKTPIYSLTAQTEINYAKANNKTDDIIWYTEVFSDRQLVNLLLLLIGKSTDTQTVFGNGFYTGTSLSSNYSSLLETGTLNTKGCFYGSDKGVKVFGIEHWWGNQWRRVAGLINKSGVMYIKMTYGQFDNSKVDGYNTDASGYNIIENTINTTTNSCIKKMSVTECGLIPLASGGSTTTYYADALWFEKSSTCYALLGGGSYNNESVGAFCISLANAGSSSRWGYGASISCKPLSKT